METLERIFAFAKSNCNTQEKLNAKFRTTEFHVIRMTGYGVIAEKPRASKLGQIFPCTL